jgi:hypothetical protein
MLPDPMMTLTLSQVRWPQQPERLIWLGGRPGVNLDGRSVFQLRRGSRSFWEVAVEWPHWFGFSGELIWPEADAVLLGSSSAIYALNLADGAVLLQRELGSYSCAFQLSPDQTRLYVLDGEQVTCLAASLAVVWVSSPIAVDGLQFEALEGDRLIVLAEMDPPGDWWRVELDLLSGRELSRGRSRS